MNELIILIVGIMIGFTIGYKARKQERPADGTGWGSNQTDSILDEQQKKVMYHSDADRIRELNLLSPNESKFMRILQHEFVEHFVVVKAKRFFIVNSDNYPIAIFEYRDGSDVFKAQDTEDGLLLFVYKGSMSSLAIKEDAQLVLSQ